MSADTRERKFAAAEGVLNHIEALGESNRMAKIAAIMQFAERIYSAAREHEREDNYVVANQN